MLYLEDTIVICQGESVSGAALARMDSRPASPLCLLHVYCSHGRGAEHMTMAAHWVSNNAKFVSCFAA